MTECHLINLSSTKGPDADIVVWDDYSSEYGLDWLEQFGTAIREERHLGPDLLRFRELKYFMTHGQYTHAYFTDNDAIHDPKWVHMAFDILRKHNRPVGLFGSSHLTFYSKLPSERLDDDTIGMSQVGGISQLIHRGHLSKIKHIIENQQLQEKSCTPERPHDILISQHIGPFALPRISVCEHFGGGGLHNPGHDSDVAVRASDYLRRIKPHLIAYLGETETKLPPRLRKMLSGYDAQIRMI